MTNQNMMICDGLTMVMALSMSNKAVSLPNYLLTEKKLLKRCGKVSALLDSMRASSPTRTTADDQINSCSKLHHPSALSMFEEIMASWKGKQIVVFLDYDGTLSPIVEDPDSAFMTTEMREAVRDVAKCFPTAIVSGRCRAKVFNFVRLPELYYAGSHGMDIKGPAAKGNQTVVCQPAREFQPMIHEAYKALIESTKYIPGAYVENNKFCLSVHYRCVDEERWVELADGVKSVIKDYPQLKLTQGRKVLEVRPTIKWNKGNALEFLLESLGYDSNHVLPIYIGDDRTDEDAFKVLQNRGQGLGILVSKTPKETNASYTLREPLEVMHFLKRLVEWNKSSVSR